MTVEKLSTTHKAILAPTLASALHSLLKDRVITPDDSRYDEARKIFNGEIDRRPGAIIRVLDVKDIARVVDFVRQSGVELAIRSGGHSMAGHSVTEGGIMLDLSRMKALQIDIKKRTAWAETGLTAGEYTSMAGPHGLATGFGDAGSVGIGGLTLGGGVGFLVRKHGLTIDNLLAAEIVTADGQLRLVDSFTNADLFWAVRGGGGNFGVVTRFQYHLHPVDSVLGGMLVLPATSEVITGFITLAESAPEELSTICNVMTAPPMPFLPKEIHGKPVVLAFMVYAGDVEAGEKVIAPFLKLTTPLANMIRPIRYPEMYPPDQEGFHPMAVGRSVFVDSVDRTAAETILDQVRTSTASMAITQLRVLGGAFGRVAEDATAFMHRKSRIMVYINAVFEKLEEKASHEQWATNLAGILKQKDDGVYVNFLGEEGQDRVRAAYPGPTWERLKAIKNRYDPSNLFHLNQNILPD